MEDYFNLQNFKNENSILTIRVIKSFTYRLIKIYVIKLINLKNINSDQLFDMILNNIKTDDNFLHYRNVEFNTLKIYSSPNKSKPDNLVINFENDCELIIYPNNNKNCKKNLQDLNVENESEISIFNMNDYLKFKSNPLFNW